MALGSTQPLTKMSTRNLPGGGGGVKGGRAARKSDKLTYICEVIVYKMWEPRRITTLWPQWSVTGIILTFYLAKKI
jgi:hypothetical protein